MLRKMASLLCWCTFSIAIFTSGSNGQTRRAYPVPPEPAVHEAGGAPAWGNYPVALDRVAIEREAQEMAALAATIPADIEQMKKGLRPIDTSDKLKTIEKLSKRLRSQLRQ